MKWMQNCRLIITLMNKVAVYHQAWCLQDLGLILLLIILLGDGKFSRLVAEGWGSDTGASAGKG